MFIGTPCCYSCWTLKNYFIKRTLSLISSELPCKEESPWFTTVPFNLWQINNVRLFLTLVIVEYFCLQLFYIQGLYQYLLSTSGRILIFTFEILKTPLDKEYSIFYILYNKWNVIRVEFIQYASVHFSLTSFYTLYKRYIH